MFVSVQALFQRLIVLGGKPSGQYKMREGLGHGVLGGQDGGGEQEPRDMEGCSHG